MTFITDNLVIEIDVPELHYSCVYARERMTERFGLSFDAGLVPSEWRRRMYRPALKPLIRARSNFAPLVSERLGRYELMAMLFEQAGTRNIPRDRLLKGIPATVKLTRASVKRSELGEFDTFVLLGVTVDADDMKRALEAIDV